MAEVYFEKEQEKDKEDWRRAAFVASWIINTAGKSFKKDVAAEELVSFKDEVKKQRIKPASRKERKRQADKTFMLHKRKCWMLLDFDEKGKIKVFDSEKLAELREKYGKK